MKYINFLFIAILAGVFTIRYISLEERLESLGETVGKNTQNVIVVDERSKEIRAEQERRTKNVYKVPMLENAIQSSTPNVAHSVVDEKLVGLMRVAPDGGILTYTPGAEMIAGFEQGCLKGKNIGSFIKDKDEWERHKVYMKDAVLKNEDKDLSMKREVLIKGKVIRVAVKYVAAERVFIVNMTEQ